MQLTPEETREFSGHVQTLVEAVYTSCMETVDILFDSADEQAEHICQVSPKLDKNQVALGVKGACVVLKDVFTKQQTNYTKAMEEGLETMLQEKEKPVE